MISELVIIVDDDPVCRAYLSALVEKMGYSVLQLSDAANLTFSCSYFSHVKALLLDMNMPKLDGYRAAKKIRKLDRRKLGFDHLPIIAVSGIEGNQEKCFKVGCDVYLKKPVSYGELLNAFIQVGLVENKGQFVESSNSSA